MCLEKNKALGFEVNVCGEKQCGATQCPTEESLTGRLVKIFDILRACVNSGTTNQEAFDLINCLFDDASTYYKSNK